MKARLKYPLGAWGEWRLLFFLYALTAPVFAGGSGGLTLAEAERLALQQDPQIAAARATAEALDADAVADGQLPDPKLRTGLYNVPLDDFDLRSVPTSQLRLGVQQAFPRGDSLKYKTLRKQSQAEAQRQKSRVQILRARRAVRLGYLDLYYYREAERISRASRGLFASLQEITQAHYAAGSSSQQDVLRAELELSRLDDRITAFVNGAEKARGALSRWIGDSAWRQLASGFPQLPKLPTTQVLQEQLEKHPGILLQSALMQSSEEAVHLAQEQYKPGWTAGIEYRMRFGDNPDGSDRGDMAAVMFSMDLPVFSAQRQDQRLAASQKRADAAFYRRDNLMRQLRKTLAVESANRKRLSERLQRYQQQLLQQAQANAEAALLAYQSGTSDFTALMRARITELDVRLQALKLRVDLAKAAARLLYLNSGEAK